MTSNPCRYCARSATTDLTRMTCDVCDKKLPDRGPGAPYSFDINIGEGDLIQPETHYVCERCFVGNPDGCLAALGRHNYMALWVSWKSSLQDGLPHFRGHHAGMIFQYPTRVSAQAQLYEGDSGASGPGVAAPPPEPEPINGSTTEEESPVPLSPRSNRSRSRSPARRQ